MHSKASAEGLVKVTDAYRIDGIGDMSSAAQPMVSCRSCINNYGLNDKQSEVVLQFIAFNKVKTV